MSQKDKPDMSVDQILDAIRGVIHSKEIKPPKKPAVTEDVLELTQEVDKDDIILLNNEAAATSKTLNDYIEIAVSSTKESQHNKNIDEIIKEIVKSEVKTWLNENLHALVKEVVTEELSRLVSKRKK